MYATLTRLRKPYHYEHDFPGLALDPRGADIVVVKIGYLEPELFDMSAGWKMALTSPRAASTRTCSGCATAVSAAPVPVRPGDARPGPHGPDHPPSNTTLDGADE